MRKIQCLWNFHKFKFPHEKKLSKIKNTVYLKPNLAFFKFCKKAAGSQKDRHRGTSGAKEGFCSIGRLRKNITYLVYFVPFFSHSELLNGKLWPLHLFSIQKLLIRWCLKQFISKSVTIRVRKLLSCYVGC